MPRELPELCRRQGSAQLQWTWPFSGTACVGVGTTFGFFALVVDPPVHSLYKNVFAEEGPRRCRLHPCRRDVYNIGSCTPCRAT